MKRNRRLGIIHPHPDTLTSDERNILYKIALDRYGANSIVTRQFAPRHQNPPKRKQ